MNRKTIVYWALTGLFCAVFLFGGIGHLFRTEMIAEGIASLGYPAYLMSILGVAKLLGVAVLLVPEKPLLKEWAYAGFTFDLLGATASHTFSGGPLSEIAPPVIILLIGAGSYFLRPAARRLRLVGSNASEQAGQPAH